MRLLLDEMYDRAIAEELRARGHDVVAATERPVLRGLGDDALLRAAAAERRVILTENAAHMMPAFEDMLTTGESTSGLLVSSPRSMPRGRETVGLFVRALDRHLAEHPAEDALAGRIAWLAPAGG